jgi:nitrate reductase gamma subunit
MGIDPNVLLTWARETGLPIAVAVFLFGVTLRLIEVFSLGRKKDLSTPRALTPGSGWRTLFTRSAPPPAVFKRAAATLVSGYVFHIGFFFTLFLFRPHIMLFHDVTGMTWPGLPSPVVDAVAVMSLLALLFVAVYRFIDPVKRFLSGFGDWLALAATTLPLLTGYLAFHHLLLPYTLMLALHILSVEFLLVVLPFTKLTHSFTLFTARWFNGDIAARKGVAS